MTTTYKLNYAELRQQIPFEQVFTYLGLDKIVPRIKANQHKGTCPFCKSAKSFVATYDGGEDKTGRFNCFACKSGGDCIELVNRMRGNPRRDSRGVYQAAVELRERFLTVTPPSGTVGTVTKEPGTVSTVTRSDDGGALLAKLQKALEGVEPGHPAVVSLGLSEETCRHFGAGYKNTGVSAKRLLIPVHDRSGTLVAICGRAVSEDQQPKFLFHHFDPGQTIFNAHRLKEGQDLYICHDPLDVMLSYENDPSLNVVAVFNDGLTSAQHDLISGLIMSLKCELSFSL